MLYFLKDGKNEKFNQMIEFSKRQKCEMRNAKIFYFLEMSNDIELQTIKNGKFLSLRCRLRLLLFRVGNKSQFCCALCSSVFQRDAVLFGCKACNFNVCVNCFIQKKTLNHKNISLTR